MAAAYQKYLDLDFTLNWLKSLERSPAGGTRLILILVSESLYDRVSSNLYQGYADAHFVIVHYSTDFHTLVDRIIHEVGHFCGAGHPMGQYPFERPDDIRQYYTSVARKVIKENCG